MNDLNKHRIDFADGFQDGYIRSENGLPCRWIDHKDINDGFTSPNHIYTFAYENGYKFQKMKGELTDKNIEELYLVLIRFLFSKHHKDFNL